MMHRMNAMDRTTAILMDRKGSFYADVEENMYGVFGTESGFCYEWTVDSDEANKLAAQMNLDWGAS